MPPSVVIAHVSDLHLGAHDDDAVATLPADVAATSPALTVVTGDLTMRARRRQFAAARELLAALPRPQLLILGNHDVPLLDAASRLASPYDRYVDGVEDVADPDFDPLDPVIDVPGIRAIGLASMPRWRWKAGRVSARQAALVESALRASPAGALRVVAMHHPPFVRGMQRVAGRGALREALVAGSADLVLAGHTHVPAARIVAVTAGGVTRHLVEDVAGTTTSTRIRGTRRSWSLVLADPETITVVHRAHDDSGWVEARRETFPRQMTESG